MKRLKRIDFWISVALIAFFIGAAIADNKSNLNETLLLGYLIIGTWQSISMILHNAKGVFVKRWSQRFNYHCVSLLAVLGLFTGSPWIYLMYWIAPFMALFYTYICYRETFIKMRRPLDLLK